MESWGWNIVLHHKNYHDDWSAFHMLVDVSCHVSDQEQKNKKKGICVLSLLNQQVCPKKPRSPPRVADVIASDQENTFHKGMTRKRKQCLDEFHNEKKNKKKKKKRRYMMRVDKDVYQPPPDLPEKYKEMTNGAKAELVIQKQLFTSDVNRDLNRLSLPPKQILCKEFLRAEEIERLQPKDTFMKVPFIVFGKEEKISVSLWKLSSANEKSPVLNSEWNDIVKKNGLVEGDLIQIWSFRDRDDQLKLALDVVKRAEERETGEERVSNVNEGNASASQNGRKCLKIKFKVRARRSDSSSTSELLSQ